MVESLFSLVISVPPMAVGAWGSIFGGLWVPFVGLGRVLQFVVVSFWLSVG